MRERMKNIDSRGFFSKLFRSHSMDEMSLPLSKQTNNLDFIEEQFNLNKKNIEKKARHYKLPLMG